MSGGGPLIPGLTEFDRPKGKRPAWIGWLIAIVLIIVALVVVAGFVGGVGPLKVLGTTTISAQPMSYRGAAGDSTIEISVAMPESGLCREDEIGITAFERSNRIEVEAVISRSRSGQCTVTTMGGDLRWTEVALTQPLGERTVIRVPDREPLPRA